MIITLKNFRCYENSSFDFGSNGIVLVAGGSGQGKTSILMAISFVLFGKGTKIITYGKNTCSVSLTFEDMTIVRTKKPNRLQVIISDIPYEDETAQNIINKKFGETFNTTGYIAQNARDSFVLMSPIEKLGFIERFAFQDVNISVIMKRCKDLIKERNETLIRTTSQLEASLTVLTDLKQPEKVNFPLKCSLKNRVKVIKNEVIKNKNTATLLELCKRNIQSLSKELASINVLNAYLHSNQESLDLVIKKLGDLSVSKDDLMYEVRSDVGEYENMLLIMLSKNRYNEDVIVLDKMKEEESTNIKNKIATIKVWDEYTEEDSHTMVSEYKQIIKDIERLENLKHKLIGNKVDKDTQDGLLNKLKDYTQELLQKEVFQCPSCYVNLKLQNDKLCIYELLGTLLISGSDKSTLTTNISNLEVLISCNQHKIDRYTEIEKSIQDIKESYEEELPTLDEIKKDLDYIKKYITTNQLKNKELDTLNIALTNKIYSHTIVSFENNVLQKINKIKDSSVLIQSEVLSEEQLRDYISAQRQVKDRIKSIDNELGILGKERHKYEKQIKEYKDNHIEKYKNLRDVMTVDNELKIKIIEKKELETKKVAYENILQDIELYKEYEAANNIYSSWINKVDQLKDEEVKCRKLYGASILMKEKILEAETIAMLNIISSINTHTQQYLECFFPDNPISVKLVTFKENKSGCRPQLNLQIEYKGMEADINMLSGGESSRIILAFSLALGEMFNTPIMLLDECTASLDQELTSVVIDGIRANFSGKLVILIAHQSITGMFDKVMNL